MRLIAGASQARAEPRRNCARPQASRVEPSLTLLEPRKLPRQARARATFEAIVDACGQLLVSGSYDALTTNSISERAGVSIGTLYEYFPNRESIVAALAARACRRLVRRMIAAAEESAHLPDFPALEHLIRQGVVAMSGPETVFKVLVREAPFVVRLPDFRDARATLDLLCEGIRQGAGERVNLPEPVIDAWLLSQMMFSAMLEIACLETPEADRELRIRELARLTFRMVIGRDPTAAEMAQTAQGACRSGA